MDHLKCIRTFVQIGRSENLSTAAAKLGISRSLASAHLMQLEDHLGARLIMRTTRQCELTAAGEEYLQMCLKALTVLDDADARIGYLQSQVAGQIKVMASFAFGTFQLAPIITNFAQHHRKTTISLSLFDRSFSAEEFLAGGFDIGISTGPIRQADLISTKISETSWIPCATRKYLDSSPRLRAPSDLTSHLCLIHQSHAPKGVWTFIRPSGKIEVAVKGPLTTNSSAVLRNAALSDLGVAMLPIYMVETDLKRGDLMHVLPGARPCNQSIFLVYPPAKRLPRRLRVFVDYVKSSLRNKPRGSEMV